MEGPGRSWVLFILRWGIAIAGIWWVIAQISIRDYVHVLDEQTNRPFRAALLEPSVELEAGCRILDPRTGQARQIPRQLLVNKPDRRHVEVVSPGRTRRAQLLALDLTDDLRQVLRLLVADDATGRGVWIGPAQAPGYRLSVPNPLVEIGLGRMVRRADPRLLILAVLIFPATFLLTSVRWHRLLRALEIEIPLSRAFVLNMVGAFYNTFMLGVTGGDVLKAWYAAKQTVTRRTRAVLSVFIDRAIGLLALVMLGGFMAAVQYASAGGDDPAARACLRVAVGAVVLLAAVAAGLTVFYQPALRRALGIDFVISRLPMQRQVAKTIEAMELYRRRPGRVAWALLITFPVHITVILSAMLSGLALNLPISPMYYFVAVPVIVLSGSVPISFQGAGVMEFFAVILTARQGATVSEAFALTLSIRLVQILWNLTGGIFVFRGGYHAPSEIERRSLDGDPLAVST